MKPKGCACGNLKGSSRLVRSGDGQALPKRLVRFEELLQGKQPLAFFARTPFATVGRSSLIQGRIQAQAGYHGDGHVEILASGEEIEGSVGLIAHHNDGLLWQPTAQLKDHRASPVRNFLQFAASCFLITLRGS